MEISINPTAVKQNTSFRQITLIQVPRSAFANPENINECSALFTKKLDAITNDSHYGLLGMIKPHKFVNVMESMSYLATKSSMLKTGLNYSIEWAIQSTGLPIKKSIDERYYSFFVFTKEHINIFKKAMSSVKNFLQYLQEAKNKYPNDNDMAILYATAKYGVEADKIMDINGASTPAETIKLNSLNELAFVKNKLGV